VRLLTAALPLALHPQATVTKTDRVSIRINHIRSNELVELKCSYMQLL
jgi:hypothetical protein